MSPRPDILFLDANVLYSACARDLLIEASLVGLCHCRWSDQVLSEVRIALHRKRPDLRPPQVDRLFQLLALACPEALNRLRPEVSLRLLPLIDPADGHVIQGAYTARADVIITFNLRHFPRRHLSPLGLKAMTPDHWLLAKAKADPEGMGELAERCRLRLARPPLSKADHLKALRRSGLTQFAVFLDSR
jgi:predicted nucleic acid-binding protein